MMNKKTIGVLVAFAVGQVTQLIIHAVVIGFSMWDNRRIAFCAAAGFIILFAAIAGVYIASDKFTGERVVKKKTYLDYARVPETNESGIVDGIIEELF